MTVARSKCNYAAHKRWRRKNQLRGLTADGKVRGPARVRMSAELRRGVNTLRMRAWRERNLQEGLTWNGRRRARPLLLGVFFERLARAIARVFVFLPPDCQQELAALGRQMSVIRRKHGHRKVWVRI